MKYEQIDALLDSDFDLSMNTYQLASSGTAIFPEEYGPIYPALKLAGESGEVAEKIGKLLRDTDWTPAQPIPSDKQEELIKELGDVQWYIAQLAWTIDATLDDVAKTNLEKLYGRQERGTLGGSGDER